MVTKQVTQQLISRPIKDIDNYVFPALMKALSRINENYPYSMVILTAPITNCL